jgi:Cu(I)/Ag(I) efflux system membrane protein CusA/SilA
MIGGIVTSFVLELLIYPVIFEIWKGKELGKSAANGGKE